MAKLAHYGIRGLTNSWLSSFLKNRTQYIYLDGHCSITKQVTCSVLQGPTACPLLFLVYIIDLQCAFSKSIIHIFADDTNLLFPAKKLGTIESVVNYELKILSLNKTKTELIMYRSPRKNLPQEPDIRINDYKFTLHSHVKYLGILIDEVLSWNKQIESICMKLARANCILSKLRYFVPKDICISVYYSLFYTHLITVVLFGPILEKVILIV